MIYIGFPRHFMASLWAYFNFNRELMVTMASSSSDGHKPPAAKACKACNTCAGIEHLG